MASIGVPSCDRASPGGVAVAEGDAASAYFGQDGSNAIASTHRASSRQDTASAATTTATTTTEKPARSNRPRINWCQPTIEVSCDKTLAQTSGDGTGGLPALVASPQVCHCTTVPSPSVLRTTAQNTLDGSCYLTRSPPETPRAY